MFLKEISLLKLYYLEVSLFIWYQKHSRNCCEMLLLFKIMVSILKC